MAELPDAPIPTALDWEVHARSYVELLRRIHSEQRMERLKSELKALAERVHELEGHATKSSVRPSSTSRVVESTSSPFAAVEAECEGWEEIEGIEFRSTEGFERDLAALPDAERDRVINAINAKSQLLVKDRTASAREFIRPYKILLHGGLESSMTEARVGRDLRVLLTLDDDPIFGQVIVTLLRVVRRGELKRAFDETVQLLYPNQLLDIQTPEK